MGPSNTPRNAEIVLRAFSLKIIVYPKMTKCPEKPESPIDYNYHIFLIFLIVFLHSDIILIETRWNHINYTKILFLTWTNMRIIKLRLPRRLKSGKIRLSPVKSGEVRWSPVKSVGGPLLTLKSIKNTCFFIVFHKIHTPGKHYFARFGTKLNKTWNLIK